MAHWTNTSVGMWVTVAEGLIPVAADEERGCDGLRSSPVRLLSGYRAQLFTDTEAGEDSPQQIIRAECPGNLSQRLLRHA